MIKNVHILLDDLSHQFAKFQLGSRELEHKLLEIIATELRENRLDQATWLKAFSQSRGDKDKAEALYIKLRLRRLMDQLRSARVQVMEEARANREYLREDQVVEEAADYVEFDEEDGESRLQKILILFAALLLGGIAVFGLVMQGDETSAIDERVITASYTYPVIPESNEQSQELGADTVLQPSFDCRQTSNLAEQLICTDEDLARQDALMAVTYRNLRDSLPTQQRKELTTSQIDWLAERNGCASLSCVSLAYDRWFSATGQAPGGRAISSGDEAPGPIAAPVLDGRWSNYRTKIQQDWYSEPTLGGRYVIIRLGCGTGCTFNFVGDHKTGQIYELGLGGEDMQMLELRFTDSDTRLGAQWEDFASNSCVRQDFVWNGTQLDATSPPTQRSREGGCPPST